MKINLKYNPVFSKYHQGKYTVYRKIVDSDRSNYMNVLLYGGKYNPSSFIPGNSYLARMISTREL